MFGFIEIISLLLGLAGFGLHPNPKAPTLDQTLQYAMPDPDVTVQVDVTSVLGDNYKAFVALPQQPQIQQSPDLAKTIQQVVDQVEGGRGMVQGMTGVNVATDVADVTVFGQFVAGQNDPVALAVIHGKFTVDQVDKIGALMGAKPQKIGGGEEVEAGGNAIALTKDNVLLVGTATLVRERLADTWKAPKHGAGTTLGLVAKALDGKPVMAVALTMSPDARAKLAAQFGGSKNFATDVLARHKLAALSLYHDGLAWQWIDSTKDGLDQMAEVSDGMIDLLRAAELAPRGFAKLALGGLESYRGVDPKIDMVLAHKADLEKIIASYTSDGQFQKSVVKNPQALSLTVRLTGKTLSDVLPISALAPAAVGFFLMQRSSASAPPPQQPPQQHPQRPIHQLPASPFTGGH
jgi:hypothetical protein|nr:hypothetical protein [Kofleriaceae bacterium]